MAAEQADPADRSTAPLRTAVARPLMGSVRHHSDAQRDATLRSEKPLKSDPVSRRHRLSVSQCFLVAALAVVCLSSHAADLGHRIARVGYLSQLSPSADSTFEAFSKRLRELGYIEGQNLFLEARFADGHIDRLPPLAAELVEHKMYRSRSIRTRLANPLLAGAQAAGLSPLLVCR
jgi:hypothetical protein